MQTLYRILRLCALNVKRHLFAHHHLGKHVLIGTRRLHGRDVFALAKDRHAVGYLKHLVHLMCYYDYRLAVRPHLSHNVKELFGLLRSENRRRFVKYQDIGTAVKNLKYLHRLLFRHRHFIYFFLRIKLKAVFFADLPDVFRRLVQPVIFILNAENDILGCRKDVDQLKVLVHHTDLIFVRVLGGTDNCGFPVNEDFSLVGKINSRYHIHKRRFAASVLAENGEYFSPLKGKVHIVVSDNAAKAFRNVL